MSRGIADLIQENKRRFYAGEIRNSFYEDSLDKRQSTIVVDHTSVFKPKNSFWTDLKTYGQKISEDLFYEPVK